MAGKKKNEENIETKIEQPKENKKKVVKETKKESVNDLSMVSPELIALLTNQIKAELMSNMPQPHTVEIDEEEKLLNKKVKVTSISSGAVGVYLLNGRFVKWDKSGDTMMLKVEELVNMNSVSEIYLDQPLLVIEDDETIEYLGLTEKYELLTKASNVDELLQLNKDEISDILSALSKEMRADLSMEILRRIKNNDIDSRSMVEFLKRKLKLEE